MENPKSLKWALANGYQIANIIGTDNVYCEVVVVNNNPPTDYRKVFSFLMKSTWMKQRFTDLYNEISLPF